MNTHQRNGQTLSNGGGTDVRIAEMQNFLDALSGQCLTAPHFDFFHAGVRSAPRLQEIWSDSLESELGNIGVDDFPDITGNAHISQLGNFSHGDEHVFAEKLLPTLRAFDPQIPVVDMQLRPP
jgi:hypothetical protein